MKTFRLSPSTEAWLVCLIAAHSIAVGLMLLLVPLWAARLGGWQHVEPTFFVRQAGIFHLVLAMGYLIEYIRYHGVILIISAKCVAVGFLTVTALLIDLPWAVPVSAVGDAAMAALMWLVHTKHRQPSTRASAQQ